MLTDSEEINEPKKKYKGWLYLIILGLFVFGFFFYRESQLILKFGITSWTENHNADCGVVLTGSSSRVAEGFSLLQQLRVKKLIISGVHPQAKLREIFPQWPFYSNLNPEDIVLEKRSGTTWGNAKQTAALVEAIGCRSIVLITSRLHMRRSLLTFQSNLPENFEIQARSVASGRVSPDLSSLIIETLKSLFYEIWAY